MCEPCIRPITQAVGHVDGIMSTASDDLETTIPI